MASINVGTDFILSITGDLTITEATQVFENGVFIFASMQPEEAGRIAKALDALPHMLELARRVGKIWDCQDDAHKSMLMVGLDKLAEDGIKKSGVVC